MSDSSTTLDQLSDVAAAWWLLLMIGGLSVVAGVIILEKPSHSLTTLAVISGVFILLDSILELARSLSTDRSAVGALLGVLGIVIGILLIRHPIHGVLAIGLLIGIWLVAIGVVRLLTAFALEHPGWNTLLAVIEIIAGIVIVSSPDDRFNALALIVGISFVVNGIGVLALGWSVYVLRREASGTGAEPGLNT